MNQAARLGYRRALSQRPAVTQLGRPRAITHVAARPASLRNWWFSAAALGLAGVIELILAGRMAIQTIDLHGALAQLVFDAGGILQSPFVDISKQPVYAHGVFEPDTIRAIIAYAALGLVVPALGLVGSIPGGSFNFVRGTGRLIGATAIALADLTKDSARAARWAWLTAPQLSHEARPTFERVRARTLEASSRVGPALEGARVRASAASSRIGPALEQGRTRITAAIQQIRPAADQSLANARQRQQQLGPALGRSREWARQASQEATSFLKELQAWAASAAQVYRRWADGLAAKRD